MNTWDPTRQIAIIWDIDDVKMVNNNLTDEQAFEVLQNLDFFHDANYGICWEAIEVTIRELYPEVGEQWGTL